MYMNIGINKVYIYICLIYIYIYAYYRSLSLSKLCFVPLGIYIYISRYKCKYIYMHITDHYPCQSCVEIFSKLSLEMEES